MEPFLRHTHFEYVGRHRPGLVEMAERHLASAPHLAEERLCLNGNEAIQGERHQLLLEVLGRNARQELAARGVDTRGLSPIRALSLAPLDWRKEMAEVAVGEYTSILNWMIAGRKTFLFREHLTERLADTELNVPTEAFALPFRACMFVYDHAVARRAIHAISGRDAPDEGTVTAWLSLMGGERGLALGIVAAHTVGERCLTHTRRSLSLEGARTVEDAIRTVHPVPREGSIGDEAFFGPGFRFYRMIVNSALYLSSADPDVTDALRTERPGNFSKLTYHEKAAIKREISQASRLSYVRVGDSVGPKPEGPTDGSGRKLDRRLRVRSHWRMQPHGPKGSLRKAILIDEHWKGPDAAEVLSRPYSVR